jgi:hypothetical protein
MRGVFSHPHLIWNLLHRADEHIILLMPPDELYARALDVKTDFDVTITEEKVRGDVLGDKGKLTEAIDDIKKHGQNIERSTYILKDTLQYLNEKVDTGYWILSMNILMSVCSAIMLGILMVIYFIFYYQQQVAGDNLMRFAILGLMGAYTSNLITSEDFLFVRGGPFWRFFLQNLMVRPVIGAFSATFIFLVEKSKLVFSINPLKVGPAPPVQPTIININVNENVIEYVYIVLAIAAGFAGAKILRTMIDSVLKRLEEKAEKTKEAKTDKKNKTST